MKFPVRGCILAAASLLPLSTMADDNHAGHLLIVGGGLRPDNLAVFERLIEYAGGKERARFGIFPTASLTKTSAEQLKLVLSRLGVPADQVQVIDLTVFNAKQQAANPLVVDQIRQCTGIYFEGGDQTRITGALTNQDGSETPALAAIYAAWKQGAVVAGSSAGAAVQSETMISVSGLPDAMLDEGMDALDFGLSRNATQRGLFVSRGLAFFKAGVIDQHFSQYRGRLGRLSRVVIESKAKYGFGIDENTALDVAPNGMIEVVGSGAVTIVEGANAKLTDGPLGCHIQGVRVSCLEAGDRFDLATHKVTPRQEKHAIVPGQQANNGNFLIPDINGRGAALDAIMAGLADNSARKQVGIALKHNQHHAHGYRFTFRKTDQTECYEGYIDGLYANTVLGVELDVAPILGTLYSPEQRTPIDLPSGAAGNKLSAVWFRGILLANEDRRLRPADAITRAELAGAIAQFVRLEPARQKALVITDVPMDSPFADEISLVVGGRLMHLKDSAAFDPGQTVSRQEAAVIFEQVAALYRGGPLPAEAIALEDLEAIAPTNRVAVFAAVRFGMLQTAKSRFLPEQSLSRQEAAEALCKIAGFSW